MRTDDRMWSGDKERMTIIGGGRRQIGRYFNKAFSFNESTRSALSAVFKVLGRYRSLTEQQAW